MAGQKKRGNRKKEQTDYALRDEIIAFAILAVMIYLFLCNFGICGKLGDAISRVQFGLFGIVAYLMPVAVLAGGLFYISNAGAKEAVRKIVAGGVLLFVAGIVADALKGRQAAAIADEAHRLRDFYVSSAEIRGGGGLFSGIAGYFGYKYLGATGTILLLVVCALICGVILTERSLIRLLRDGSRAAMQHAHDDTENYRAYRKKQRERIEERREKSRQRREEARRKKEAEAEERRQAEEARRRQEASDGEEPAETEPKEEKAPRTSRKAEGVTFNTDLRSEDAREHGAEDRPGSAPGGEEAEKTQAVQTEEPWQETGAEAMSAERSAQFPEENAPAQQAAYQTGDEMHEIFIRPSIRDDFIPAEEEPAAEDLAEPAFSGFDAEVSGGSGEETAQAAQTGADPVPEEMDNGGLKETHRTAQRGRKAAADRAAEEEGDVSQREYRFPPIDLLNKAKGNVRTDSGASLRETATKLEKILSTFGVNAKVTDFSQGPTVTRFELQPEVGVRVSKIMKLSDDIKLNLAVTDIRIEAPIPGKVAVGIEVPNKEVMPVSLRDLLESAEYTGAQESLSFAVGTDISGKTVIGDIAKMPHLLIAGSTGSGKSVCINTILLSILYKSRPEDVRLIMIDPKVVELSGYNGIPHLLIPVVTDPKKAAGALNWAVAEMTERFKKFADAEVRDLAGYNHYVDMKRNEQTDEPDGKEEPLHRLPKIVVVVDELADLMMVAKNDVENAIVRLTQLARAAGIHLIIATQRPSVDVITGLIKANTPSRIAFAVASGTDSRTILDMNGAERLLGKGDMLFAPQYYSKPVRIQGAFVSDEEIQRVCDFLKEQNLASYDESVAQGINSSSESGGVQQAEGDAPESEYDEYFAEAGRFIIERERASIGNLQRKFKIGFNRAARIMDQLAEAGVVGEEEGTKPRHILMTAEEFGQFCEDNGI